MQIKEKTKKVRQRTRWHVYLQLQMCWERAKGTTLPYCHSVLKSQGPRMFFMLFNSYERYTNTECIDSVPCLQALDHLKTDHPIISQILAKLNSFGASDFAIHLGSSRPRQHPWE